MTPRLRLMHRAAKTGKLYVYKNTTHSALRDYQWIAAKYEEGTLLTLAAGCGATPLDAMRNLKFNLHIGELSATR